jgi:hypothetical protein
MLNCAYILWTPLYILHFVCTRLKGLQTICSAIVKPAARVCFSEQYMKWEWIVPTAVIGNDENKLGVYM